MKRLRATGSGVVRIALLLGVIASLNVAQANSSGPTDTRVGLLRPAAGIGLRTMQKNPPPCGPKQIHLFVNRPCTPKTGGDDTGTNNGQTNTGQTGGNDSGDKHTGNNNSGGGPVVVLGGSPYNLDDNGSSGNGSPNSDNNPPVHNDIQLPAHIDPTPEPTYMVVTGLAFAAVWIVGRKRRTA